MSQRVKRTLKSDDGPVPTKRRKGRPTMDDDDAASIADSMGPWSSRTQDSLKPPNIYNRAVAEAPAELFRKDLISAMKLADSEPLSADEYWVIGDQWKQEWERGVQVPVNPDSLPGPSVRIISHSASSLKPGHDFRLPKSKYLAICKDDTFDPETHILSDTSAKAEKACSYDLDDCDVAWLHIVNGERATMGLQPLKEEQLERVIEELEVRCWDKIQTIVKTEESLGIEFDENVICDVCRSPDSEESNEMVFCDSCNICVHQACYGITAIPSGQWLCRTCALGKRPECVLCPNKMGAMKSTQSGSKWAHVSCALWIPEVSIGSVEKMEPITKISSIPQSRWALICVLCRERVGACIQCSVKSCKTAYHVTCAFKHGLEMRAIIEDEAAEDGVKLRSYCQKHSVTSKENKKSSASSEDDESKRKKRKDMTSEEKNQARAAKLQEIEAEFDKHVSHTDVQQCLDVDPEGIVYVYNYWKLKRRAGGNKPLLAPKSDDVDLLSQKQEQADLDKMRMFVQLRQDLERVRNLCYMVSRREKLSRSFFRLREQTFHKQAAVLSDAKCTLSTVEVQAVIDANHGPSIYDRLYSHGTSESYDMDFDVILARIAGLAVPEDKEKPKTSELNGLVKSSGGRRSGDNPYKRMYLNGASRRRSSLYGSMSSGSETDSGAHPRKDTRLGLDSSASSTEEDKPPVERKPLRDKNESKTSSPSPAKSPSKTSRAAMLGLESAASSTEEEKPSKKANKNRKSSPISSKVPEDSTHQPSSKTASRLASLGLDSGASSTEDEKNKAEISKRQRNRKMPILSGKKRAEKDKSTSKASTMARLGLESPGSSTEEEKPTIKKLSTDATAPAKRRGKKSAAVPTRSRKDSSSDDEATGKLVKNKSSEPRNHLKKAEVDSDAKMSLSEDSDNDLLIRSSSKTDSKKFSAIYSDSDSDGSKDGSSSNMTGDHHLNMMRTKGAMKEFSGLPSKSGVKSTKKLSKAKSKDDTVDEPSRDKENIKTSRKTENVPTDLIVPQRQAAKKASESIQKVSQGRMKDLDVEKDMSVKQSFSETEKSKLKHKTKDEERRSKLSREPKSSSDIYEFDKDPDGQEILAYVPQRQAAKKAAEHMKTSIKKSDKDGQETTRPEKEKEKKDTESDRSKRPPKPDVQTKKVSKSSSSSCTSSSSSSSSSGSSSNSSSSSSDSDSDERSKSPVKKELRADKSPEPVSDVKKGVSKKEDWPFLGKVSQSSDSSSLDSDSDSDKDKDSKKASNRSKSSPKEKEGSVSHLAGKKFRKAPDKKLKTSAGRPELELQQPPIERNEPFRPKEKMGGSLKTNNTKACDGLRIVEGGSVERRSGAISDAKNAISSKESQQRGKPRSKRTEESSSDRRRAGEQDSDAGKEQFKSGKRKSEENSSVSEPRPPLRRPEATDNPHKEERKSQHSPTEVKKASKKINLQSPDKDLPQRRKSTRNSILDAALDSKLDLVDSMKARRILKSSGNDIQGRQLSVPQLTLPDNFDLKHDENLSKTFNSIPTPVDKISPVIDSSKQSSRLDTVREKRISEESRASSSSSSSSCTSSSTSTDEGLGGKDMTSVTLCDNDRMASSNVITSKLPLDLPLPQQDADIKSISSEPNKASCLDTNVEYIGADPELIEPKKISSRNSSLSGAPYQQRSIFSPQQPKDSGVSDLFDFHNDLCAVDETINDDGFGLPANSEEIMRAPLQFSFSNEYLFKDDSKEDTTRETLNLVDKLRMSYAQQKTQPGPNDLPDAAGAVQEEHAEPEVLEVVPAHPPVVDMTDEKKDDKATLGLAEIPSSMDSHGTPPISLSSEVSEVPLLKVESSSYANSESDVPFSGYPSSMETSITQSLSGTKLIDTTKNIQADERWVPPSNDGYLPPGEQPLPKSQHNDLPLNPISQEQVVLAPCQQQHSESLLSYGSQADTNQTPPLLPQDIEKSLHQPQEQQQSLGPEHFDSMGHTPHMDSPTPYSDLHSQAKWADSQVLPVRRNSTTSDSSDSEVEDQTEVETMPPAVAPAPPPVNADILASYAPSALPYQPCAVPEAFHHPYQVGSMPLFPPPSTFPSSNMYPPPYGSFPDHSHGIMPSIPKPEEAPPQIPQPCTAAFTSSSHNMAFTAAMVSPLPPAPPTTSPVLPQDPPLTPAAFPTSAAPPTPSPVLPHDTQVASTPFSSQTSLESQTELSAVESNQIPSITNKVSTSVGKKTPTKPTRSSPRVISLQQKSPGKSPGKSPRQQEPSVKPASQSRSHAGSGKKGQKVPRGSQAQAKGRGRGRARARGAHHGYNDSEFGIHSKLAGTVYDFDFEDDDMTESVENLRAMRERRRSTDVHERKGSDSSYQSQECSLSPKFSSPSHVNSKHRSAVYNQNLSDLRPPSPVDDGPVTAEDDDDLNPSPEPEETSTMNEIQNFNDCLLPGPVDMRTYSSFDTQTSSNQSAQYHNHLLGSLSAEQPETDLVEDLEKEIQATSKDKDKQTDEPRVSLPDSRQQLKVKIKGPFLDANYMAAAPTVTPMSQQQQPSMPAVAPLDSVAASGMAPGPGMSSASASGTSNLRRMRKKELLRQYCSQDMNMDDTGATSIPGHPLQPMAAPPINRTVISIPKAVASMTTIPTREDYKAVVDANMEKKRKKDKIPNFGNSYARRNNPNAQDYDDVESPPERRRSVGSTGSNNSFSTGDLSQPLKRRGRAPRIQSIPTMSGEVGVAPKLKIKIGGASAEVAVSNSVVEKKNLRVRPPKKRHTAPAPSLEELRKESMKLRLKIMADFGGGEDDKEEPQIVAQSSKKKKKKKKKLSRSSSPTPTPDVPEVQEVKVITNEVAAPKLIIRFGNKSSISGNNSGNSSMTVPSGGTAPGEIELQPKEKTVEGAEGRVEEKTGGAAPPPVEAQSAKGANAFRNSNSTPNSFLLEKSATSDASALRKVRTSKSATPIRLKLARCQEGYVMKARDEPTSLLQECVSDAGSSENAHNSTDMNTGALPLTQDCEVR